MVKRKSCKEEMVLQERVGKKRSCKEEMVLEEKVSEN